MPEEIYDAESSENSALLRARLEKFSQHIAELVAEKLSAQKPYRSVPMSELYQVYMDLHVRVHCKTWRKQERIHKKYLESWDDRQAAAITKLDIEDLFAALGANNGKTTANRIAQFLCAMFNYGIRIGLIDCPNPLFGLKHFRLKSRDRFFEKEELHRLLDAIDSLRYETTRDFFYICLYTAARHGEVTTMRWDEISFANKTWRIPDTKNGTSHLLPLSEAALKILKRRKAISTSPWVFASDRSPTGHIMKTESAWKRAIRKAGLTNARVHDLRRTHASWQALTGANLLVIGQTLNHKDLKSTQVYARLNVTAVRDAMEKAVLEMTENRTPQRKQDTSIQRGEMRSRYRYGYGIDDNNNLVPLPDELSVIGDILRMRTNGASFGAIANTLNSQRRFRRGTAWNKSHIEKICSGKLKYLSEATQ